MPRGLGAKSLIDGTWGWPASCSTRPPVQGQVRVRAAVVVVALCLAPALAASQSLGDAARREARERPKETRPPRVYTEADLHREGETPASAPAGPLAPSEGADATGTPSVKKEPEDPVRVQLDREAEARKAREREWRRLARTAQARLADAQRAHDAACGRGAVVPTGG